MYRPILVGKKNDNTNHLEEGNTLQAKINQKPKHNLECNLTWYCFSFARNSLSLSASNVLKIIEFSRFNKLSKLSFVVEFYREFYVYSNIVNTVVDATLIELKRDSVYKINFSKCQISFLCLRLNDSMKVFNNVAIDFSSRRFEKNVMEFRL